MTISRWDPFRDLVSLQERMNRLFDESLRGRTSEENISTAAWAPAVDIYQTEEAIVVKAELPEVNREDIDIQVENNVLTLRGERRIRNEVRKENYFRMERQYGSFIRSFTLPADMDAERIAAAYRDGVLTIEIPKGSESKSRHIKIK